jgi:hypothetical protein
VDITFSRLALKLLRVGQCHRPALRDLQSILGKIENAAKLVAPRLFSFRLMWHHILKSDYDRLRLVIKQLSDILAEQVNKQV